MKTTIAIALAFLAVTASSLTIHSSRRQNNTASGSSDGVSDDLKLAGRRVCRQFNNACEAWVQAIIPEPKKDPASEYYKFDAIDECDQNWGSRSDCPSKMAEVMKCMSQCVKKPCKRARQEEGTEAPAESGTPERPKYNWTYLLAPQQYMMPEPAPFKKCISGCSLCIHRLRQEFPDLPF